jgi:hypothetical protein
MLNVINMMSVIMMNVVVPLLNTLMQSGILLNVDQ